MLHFSPRSALATASLLGIALAACSSDSGSNSGSTPGGAGNPAIGASGTPGAGSGGSAGMSSSAGASGSATAGSAGVGAGEAGAAGMAQGGSSGAGGSAQAGGAGGQGGAGGSSGFWGPSGPQKQWTCPPGPYPDQMMGAQTPICGNLTLRGNWNEGGTWIESQGAFYFSNFQIGTYTGGDVIKYVPGQDCEFWHEDVGCNGLTVSPSGNLLAACQGPRAVMEYDVVTKEGRVVADMADGKMLDSPNDLVARSDGNIYFSNRTAELGNRPVGLGEGLVRIDPEGNTSVIQMGGLNGVALSTDETKLYVVGMGTWTLDADGVPGAMGGPTPGGDGIAIDCADNILINGTNSAFGGPEMKTLLIVGGGTDMKTVEMTVPGLP